MQYNLVELIEIITTIIGEREMQFVREYEREGFTVRQMEYLDAISKLGNPNLGEIAKMINVSKPSVTAIVDKLASKGYIQKCQSDEDRRSFHVHLSSKGQKLADMHNETHHQIADLFKRNLSDRDLKTLVSILNKVVSKE